MSQADQLVITRRRKKYKFAKFDEFANCFHLDEWRKLSSVGLKACPGLCSGGESRRAEPASPSKLSETASRTGSSLWRLAGIRLGAADVSESLGDFAGNLVLEIGAGSALFSVDMARRYPENFYIAVDIKGDRLYRGAKAAIENKITNIVFVRSEIQHITEVVPAHSVSEIWITFPDPHANEDQTRLTSTGDRKRLTAPRYLELYKQTLVRKGPTLTQDGVLRFKTDNQPLFDWTVEQLTRDGWTVGDTTRDLHASDLPDDYKIATSYEQRFMTEGRPIFYLDALIK
jgi:tRNA (guanine-N7-)-methyltransferase